jgi:hypothetical protein
MRQIELLVEAYLMAERDLVAVVDAAGGTVRPDTIWFPSGKNATKVMTDSPVLIRRNS